MRATLIPALLVLTAFARHAEADDTTRQSFMSSVHRTALVELYTSEGCSSCPPADRWLSALEDAPGLWRDFVPVALHVDYWDYIGWRDRFASRRFSDRQRRYAAEGGVRVVYTPGVFSNGREWRGWRGAAPDRSDDAQVGTLTLNTNGREFTAQFEPAGSVGASSIHVALLGMGLETAVRAGENRGRTLRHDFVVLALKTMPLLAQGDVLIASATLPDTVAPADRLAVAAWVSSEDRQAPVQAVGGFLER